MLTFHYSPYVIVFAISAIISGSLALYVWKRLTIPGGIYFILLMAAVTEWVTMDSIESSIVGTSATIIHAFIDGIAGEIRVSMVRDGDRFMLKVGDDGTRPPLGLDFRNSPSLWLQLVITLVDQIRGAIVLEPGTGTTFKITFAGRQRGEKMLFSESPSKGAR